LILDTKKSSCSNICMNVSLLTAREIPNGYTWTLTSRLGDMLSLAETMFGERDKSFTILGIEFNESGPRVWYPKDIKNIVIQLTPEALNSEAIALYQLAHECVHLLSPSGSANANVLEEGVAVYFSWLYLKRTKNIEGYGFTENAPNYMTAGLLVEKALSFRPDFFKKARELSPEIWMITANDIQNLCPELNRDEARLLAMPFTKLTTNTQPNLPNTETSYNSRV
jgi:hypothetical protein